MFKFIKSLFGIGAQEKLPLVGRSIPKPPSMYDKSYRTAPPARTQTRKIADNSDDGFLTSMIVGSATDSTVSLSSPTAIARVDRPTGPPLNLSIKAVRTARSNRSKPFSSTSYISRAAIA